MPLMTWATNVLQWPIKETRNREVEANCTTRSQFGLNSATRVHEVGIASNRESECHGEYVLGVCTHRPSNHGSLQYPKPVA